MRSSEFDYTFLFEPIQNQSTQVTLLTHLEDRRDNFIVALNDNALSINGLSVVPSISADLLDLALAIHAVDRLIKRRTKTSLSFYIELPIRNFDVFTRNDVYDLLTSTLEWYTNDCWYFEFTKREIRGRNVEVQPQIPLAAWPSNTEVALWSGGLDSLSGLYTRLLTNSNTHHILIGTGSNSSVLRKQKKIAYEVNRLFPDRTSLIQIPYRWSKTPLPEKNFSQRSRGLVFILIGVACAYHMSCNSLFIYENGVGAINLPYFKGQVGLDQAKSVHPLSLLHISKLLSSILSNSFQVSNPYWLWTKAQMVASMIDVPGKDLIPLSSSCDRVHRLEAGITQCGVCTSCLLRRQSLNALGIDDLTLYDSGYINKNGEHLSAMQYQVNRIRTILQGPNPWVNLSKEYHDLDDIVDQMSLQTKQDPLFLRRQIIQLYSKYIDEWKVFEEYIEKTLQVA